MRGGFREGSVFFERQRGTPTPIPSIFSPRSWGNFNIWHNILSHATEDNRADGESHNILYQVSSCAGCGSVETRISETGSGRAGKRQETAINIRSGGRCVQPSTHRVLLDH